MARILIIEDNADNLRLMGYLLQAFGHEVVSAEDGEAGLRLAEQEAGLDLILCDVHLPKLDGYEIARQLAAHPRRGQVPLVAVTALAMVGDREKVMAAGFDGYIEKPIAPRELVGQVESFLPRGVPIPVLTAGHPPALPPEHSAVAARASARVLVVDDVPSNRYLATATLAPFGYQVTLTASVGEALEALAQQSFDLILSDLQMPDEDGFKLLSRVKADPGLRHLPFVMISSSLWEERDQERALQQGANAFLLRPVAPGRLLAVIAASLSTPGA